jgi:DNA-binding winged helix-turn-helix (wHTH) protein
LLWRGGKPVPLTAKTFDVLAYLLDHPHRVIEKEEFFQRLWPGTAVLEASLVRQISLLRKALGQRPESHDYIVTIPGRGYEFVATVEPLADLPEGLDDPVSMVQPGVASTEQGALSEAPVSAGTQSPTGSSGAQSRWAIGLGGVALIVVTVLASINRDAADSTTVSRTLQQVTFEAGSPREPSWSPDGTMIAFASDAAGNGDIWVQAVNDPRPRRLTFHERASRSLAGLPTVNRLSSDPNGMVAASTVCR